MQTLMIGLVKLYQKSISPIIKLLFPVPACRYYPTCSNFTLDAVERYGSKKGALMAFKRLLSCHPFSRGGFNPVR